MFSEFRIPPIFSPINGLKSSYVVNETIDFQYIYNCDSKSDFQISLSDFNTYSKLTLKTDTSVCNNKYSRANLTYFWEEVWTWNSPRDWNRTNRMFRYDIDNCWIAYPFNVTDKHSPDIKVPENLPNSVPSGEDLI